MSSDCKPDQTLFSATKNKNGKKRSGYARLPVALVLLFQFFAQKGNCKGFTKFLF